MSVETQKLENIKATQEIKPFLSIREFIKENSNKRKWGS